MGEDEQGYGAALARARDPLAALAPVPGQLLWDVGAGATDDGGGCMVMWEAVRTLQREPGGSRQQAKRCSPTEQPRGRVS